MSAGPERLVFVLGVQHRCGTNLLHDLLALHPCAAGHGGISEDYAVHHSGHLDAYLRGLWSRWEKDIVKGGGADPRPHLWREFGAALERFLLAPEPFSGQPPVEGKPWRVTKTPSVEHLGNLRKLFPEAPVLLLVRDGRAVAESLHRSFGWSYEEAMWAWREGARRILAFEASQPTGVRRVRFEDLVSEREATLREIFAFLGWPADAYDYAAANSLPVKGSSELRAKEGRLHWEPRDPAEFKPLHRGAHWPVSRRHRLHHLAAAELRAFGYSPGPKLPAWSRPWHRLRDALTALSRGPVRSLQRRWAGRRT